MRAPAAVKLDEKTKVRLGALGKAKRRSPQTLMKAAILEYLEREERHEREKREDLARLADFHKTGECVSDDAMMAWLDELERDLER